MDSEENDVVSKVATLGAADLVPRGSVRRSLPNASRQSKKIRTSNIKRLSKSPKTLSGFSNPRNLKCFPTRRSSQSPRKSSADFTSTDSVATFHSCSSYTCLIKASSASTKASVNSTNIDKTTNSMCAAQDPKESTPTEREADEVPPDSAPQDCLVVCVDIDCSQNTSTESGISEKETTLENEEEPAESGSESKNDETSSWHPSEDDATSVSGGSPRRPRRSAQSDGNSINVANRRKRTRKRLYCDSDSSMSSSPSCVTKENKKHKQRFASTEVDTINGFTSDREKENNGPESDDYCWICHKVGKVVICSCCPRVYHSVCLCMNHFPETWICPECQDLLVAECTLYQLPAWKNITPSQLQDMLLFLIDRLSMQHWAEHFREPVDVGVVEGYSDVIAYPMDLSTLYRVRLCSCLSCIFLSSQCLM
ncbi:Protein kinase C-binding protein 1 [Fasciola hepatica]|uniref:Protein kinase C-binding protein 1 n=1 Tax=Fasciola hepatica TaxID=6192 RepID=A0A4E0RRI4_FASHE|nr:Protein kinase C-binding protein 1 [Fasciola hepatica]